MGKIIIKIPTSTQGFGTIACTQKLHLNAIAECKSRYRGRQLHLSMSGLPNFVYVRHECSDKVAHMSRLFIALIACRFYKYQHFAPRLAKRDSYIPESLHSLIYLESHLNYRLNSTNRLLTLLWLKGGKNKMYRQINIISTQTINRNETMWFVWLFIRLSIRHDMHRSNAHCLPFQIILM